MQSSAPAYAAGREWTVGLIRQLAQRDSLRHLGALSSPQPFPRPDFAPKAALHLASFV